MGAHVSKWMSDISGACAGNPPKTYLIANKVDMEADRRITKEQGEEVAEEYSVPYFEISCKTSDGITSLFEKVHSDLLELLKEDGPKLDKKTVDVDKKSGNNK